MPNATDVIRRLADNVYTSPYDETMDAALLAAIIAFDGAPSEAVLAMPPREILNASLAALEAAAETGNEVDDGNGGTDGNGDT